VGQHLLISCRIPQKMMDDHWGDKVMISFLNETDVSLRADGAREPERPLYLTDKRTNKSFQVNYLRPAGAAGDAAPELANVGFGTGKERPWGHEGTLTPAGEERAVFRGKGGMEVEFLRTAVPQSRVVVDWDSKSTGWVGLPRENNPNNIMGGWDVNCLFRRPP